MSNFLVGVLLGERRIHVWVLVLALVSISTIQLTIGLWQYVLPAVEKLPELVNVTKEKFVPKDFSLEIKNGHLKTNLVEPYYFVISPNDVKNLFADVGINLPEGSYSKAKMRILTIDTQAKIEDFERYQTFALLTKTHVVYSDDEGTKISSYDSVKDVVFDQKSLDNFLNKLNLEDLMGKIKIFFYALPILVLILLFLGQIYLWCVMAFVIWIINRIIRSNIPFKYIFPFVALVSFPLDLLNLFLDYFTNYSIVVSLLNLPIISVLGYMFLTMAKNQTKSLDMSISRPESSSENKMT